MDFSFQPCGAGKWEGRGKKKKLIIQYTYEVSYTTASLYGRFLTSVSFHKMLCFMFASRLCVTLIDGCIYNRVKNVISLFLFREKEMESFASVIMANRSSTGLLNYHQQWDTPLG